MVANNDRQTGVGVVAAEIVDRNRFHEHKVAKEVDARLAKRHRDVLPLLLGRVRFELELGARHEHARAGFVLKKATKRKEVELFAAIDKRRAIEAGRVARTDLHQADLKVRQRRIRLKFRNESRIIQNFRFHVHPKGDRSTKGRKIKLGPQRDPADGRRCGHGRHRPECDTGAFFAQRAARWQKAHQRLAAGRVDALAQAVVVAHRIDNGIGHV